MDYRFVDSSVLQDCPAAVDMETGLIDVNKDVWDNFDDFQQKCRIFMTQRKKA